MIQGQKKEKAIDQVFHVVDFSKASPEAIGAILNALNFEVDAALAQKRFPSLDRAFSLLGPTSDLSM
jgi:hypothetical protein